MKVCNSRKQLKRLLDSSTVSKNRVDIMDLGFRVFRI